jgi:hypothetical protein
MTTSLPTATNTAGFTWAWKRKTTAKPTTFQNAQMVSVIATKAQRTISGQSQALSRAQKPFNAKNIKAFSWEIKGDVSAKTGSLAIDNFWCLGDMPLR